VRVLRAEIDGRAARADELVYPALVNYGHFTSMQVRKHAARGLDLHLERLDAATRELFGVAIDRGLVRRHIRHALGQDVGDASVRVNVFRPDPGTAPSIMVTVSPPAEAPSTPRRLQSFTYRRTMPHIKHTGTFGQIHYRQLAERNGFDDALFVYDGIVSETAIANVACCRDGVVSWPDAPSLHGICMQLLEGVLSAAGLETRRTSIGLADFRLHDAVFLTNSIGITPLGLVDEQVLPVDTEIMKTVADIYQHIAWQPV
jgi:branched-subunit amino acid aminotransferase/4-amino-4-deoxychorismate lyase